MNTDSPRLTTTSPDNQYSLSIEDASALYERAGYSRTLRTIQRYCATEHLDCRRVEVPFGEKFFITPASIAKHIAYIKETRLAAAGRATSEPVAAGTEHLSREEKRTEVASTSRDQARAAATEDAHTSRYVARLEDENTFLRRQASVKDDQIKDLTERARETNYLIQGLQTMLAPLLGRPITSTHANDAHAQEDRRAPSGGGDNHEADEQRAL